MSLLLHHRRYAGLRTGIVWLVACGAILAMGQVPATLEDDLRRISAVMVPGPAYEMEQEYHWRMFDGAGEIPQSQKVTYQAMGNHYRMLSPVGEVMQNDTAVISVFHDQKVIMIHDLAAKQTAGQPLTGWSIAALDTFVAHCTRVTMTDINQARRYTFTLKEGLCETLELVFDRETGMPEKTVITSRNIEASEAMGAIASEKLEIRYLNIQPIAPDAKAYTLGKYIQIKGGKFVPAAGLEGYQIHNYHTTLKP